MIRVVKGDNDSSFQLFSYGNDHLGEVHLFWQLGVQLDQGHSLRRTLEQICNDKSCQGWYKELFSIISKWPWPSGWSPATLTARSWIWSRALPVISSPLQLLSLQICSKSVSGSALDQVILLAVRVEGLHPDGYGHWEIIEINSY